MLPIDDSNVPQVITLSKESLDAFCDDISTMFEVDMSCEQIVATVGSLADIQKYFKKVAAVHTVISEGVLEGHFQLVFDQKGLFVLAGVIVMLPAARIIEEAKRGTLANAEGMADAVGEVGNLLIGTWDRIFRDELPGHKHFRKIGTYIGQPWEDPSQVTGLADSEQFHTVLYEVTLENYPPFHCAALYPVEAPVATTASDEAGKEHNMEVVGETVTTEVDDVQETQAVAPKEEVKDPVSATSEPEPEEVKVAVETPAEEVILEEKTETPEPATPVTEVVPAQAPVEEVVVEGKGEAPEPVVATPEPAPVIPEAMEIPADAKPTPVSRPVVEGLLNLTTLTAEAIMSQEIVWATPEASVNDVLISMQQHDVGYVLVGEGETIEGIVSKSNVLGALSPYLRPVFAKWRRPADDATLDIKVQWIMSRPVRTVHPGTAVSVLVEQMCQFGGRCLPVVDPKRGVLGLVTVFDILRVLNPDASTCLQGKTPQAPCLMV